MSTNSCKIQPEALTQPAEYRAMLTPPMQFTLAGVLICFTLGEINKDGVN